MTQKEAESVKNLAKPTVEALEVVTERECDYCNGAGWRNEAIIESGSPPTITPAKPTCSNCNGTGKLLWKWEPKVGGWCLLNDERVANEELFLISDDDDLVYVCSLAPQGKVIPILHWEEIERVLEGVGYKLGMNKFTDKQGITTYGAWFFAEECWSQAIDGKSRQRAVMRVVIELGKQIDAKSK